MKEKNSLKLEIPSNGGIVIFEDNFMKYGNQKIFYKDVTGISYQSVKHSINGLPTAQSYEFNISTKNEHISFSFSSTFYIKNKEKKDIWIQLISLSKNLIEPLLVKKIVENIFEKGETIIIGNVEFDKNGYRRTKFFGGKEQVLWSDTIYIPQYRAGNVVLFKDKEGRGKSFKQISMSTENSIILPELIQASLYYFHYYNKNNF